MSGARPVLRDYWESSRSPRYSLIFVLPLVVAYEMLAAALSQNTGGIRNGADVLIRSLFQMLLGSHGPLVLGVILTLACAYFLQRDLRASGGDLRVTVLFFMGIEAAVLAAGFGLVVGSITARLLNPLSPFAIGMNQSLSGAEKLMVSLGAGVYEELLFRVILVSALAFLFTKVLRWGKVQSSIVAVLIAATIFSLFHYIGPMGDQLLLQSFVFRLIAGVFFSALYVLRGFGITAWTHALYDVYLLL